MYANECLIQYPTHSKLHTRLSGAPKKPRKLIAFEGFATECVLGFVSTVHNVSCAIVKRVLTRNVPAVFYQNWLLDNKMECKDEVERVELEIALAKEGNLYVDTESIIPVQGVFSYEINDAFVALLTHLSADSASVAFDEFIGKYSGLRKQSYIDAWESYKKLGFVPSMAHIRAFIKFEKDLRELKPGRIPRVISPAGYVYLLLTGVYIRAVEDKIYHAINSMFGYTVVAKGLNYDALAELTEENWNSFSDPIFIDLDVEKLDASIFQEALRWSHKVVASCFPSGEREHIMRLLSYQLTSVVRGRTSDGHFSYKVKGTLTSGQMNTSLVGVLVVTSMLHKICQGRRARLTNMGDDCRIIVERAMSKGMVEEIRELFMRVNMFITVESGDVLCKSQFCQTQTIDTGSGKRTVRIPHAAINKDSVCLDDIRVPHKLAAWMLAVGQGGLATHGGIPVFDAFYRCMVRNATNYLKSAKLSKRQFRRVAQFTLKKKFLDWSIGLNYTKSRVNEESRVGFFHAFDIVPVSQQLLEDHYNSLVINFDSVRDRELIKMNLNPLFAKSL